MTRKIVTIKKDRVSKIIHNRHPWIFSGAIGKASEGIEGGDIVCVADETGKIFAQAAYNPLSSIVLRVISWNADEVLDEKWFTENIRKAALNKEKLLEINKLPEHRKNYRLVYDLSDNIPGLIIDRYGLVFVVQFHTLFADKNRSLWVSIIKNLFKPSAIYERSDVGIRKKEGLPDMPTGSLFGKLPPKFSIEEDGFKIVMDIAGGQKTGYFLDLRPARKRVEHYCRAFDVKYLQNYFGYTGSFNLYAARAGVKRIEHIDASKTANDIAIENIIKNGFEGRVSVITSDAFDHLTKTKDESVEAIILDPPSFVKERVNIDNALEGYVRLNALAIKKLVKGGLLFTFCCSSWVSENDFQKALFKATVSVRSNLKVLEKIGEGLDHAWTITFPELRYLQGWVCQKV